MESPRRLRGGDGIEPSPTTSRPAPHGTTQPIAVVLSTDLAAAEKNDAVSPITFSALSPLLETFLLQRREVSKATRGTYVLCYCCDSPYWDQRVRRLANNHAGGLVGYVYR